MKKKKIVKYKQPKVKKRIFKRKPIDASMVTTSAIERLFGVWCSKVGIQLEPQFQIGSKFYDFKVKDKKILIEFQGSYFHGDERLFEKKDLNGMQRKNKLNDKFKKNLANAEGYKLVEVWEEDFKNNSNNLKNELLKIIEDFN